jgi:hypothetical protein
MANALVLSYNQDDRPHCRPCKKLISSNTQEGQKKKLKSSLSTTASYNNSYDTKILRSGIGYDYEEPSLFNFIHQTTSSPPTTPPSLRPETSTTHPNNWSTSTTNHHTSSSTFSPPNNALDLEGTYDIILWSGIGCGGRCRNSSMGGLFSGLFDRPSFWTSQGILEFEAFSTPHTSATTTTNHNNDAASARVLPSSTHRTRIRGTLAMGKDDLAFHSKLQFEEEFDKDVYQINNQQHPQNHRASSRRRRTQDEYFLEARTTQVSFASDRVATNDHNVTSLKVKVASRTALALQSHAYRTYSSTEELVQFKTLEEAENLLRYSQHDCSQHWLYKYTEFPKEVVVQILTFLTPPPVFFVEDGDLLLEVKSNYTDTRGYICSAKTKMIARRRNHRKK